MQQWLLFMVDQTSLQLALQFVYLKEAFSPSLDEQIAVLLKVTCLQFVSCLACKQLLTCLQAYGNEGQLIVSYSVMPAWG